MKLPVPGLARGIQVLNLLSTPLTANEIVRHTRIPKTTVVRILTTLRETGLVTKGEPPRSFVATMQLLPRDSTADDFERALEGSMARIAAETNHTAEWYLPTENGQVLAHRFIPPHTQVHVRSWIGEVRPWGPQLDSVTATGRAWWSKYPGPGEDLWIFGPQCEKVPVSEAGARHLMDQAVHTGIVLDEHFNPRGIRRIASVVWGESQPVGVMAIALCSVPGLADRIDGCAGVLLREVWTLNAEAKAKLQRTERRSAEEAHAHIDDGNGPLER